MFLAFALVDILRFDPRIQIGIKDIYQQIHNAVRKREQDHAAADLRIIACIDGVHHQNAERGDGEDLLLNQRAAQHEAKMLAAARYDWDQRIAQNMMVRDLPL